MTSIQLAQLSNAFVYATMVTLTLSMLFFAFAFAVGRRPSTSAGVVRHELVESEGGTAVITKVPSPPQASR